MKILTPITIDLINAAPLPILKVQQGNVGRGALVTLTANGAIMALTDETVTAYTKKPDGTVVYASASATSDGKVRVEFTSQMIAVPGKVELELELINDSDYITTPIAILEVGKSNVNAAALESSNEFSAFVTALAQVGPASTVKLGTVKPDGTTITADTDGTIHATDQDVSNKAVAFAAATSRTNLATGDTVATGFGKIAKWFADLGTAAFKGVSNVLSQTAEGYVLDARQGKTLADRIGDLAALTTTEKSSLVGALNEQNSKITFGGWQMLSMDKGNISYRVSSDMAEIMGSSVTLNGGTIPKAGLLLGIIPENLRPQYSVYFSGEVVGAESVFYNANIKIRPNGEMLVHCPAYTGSAWNISFHTTYQLR